MAQPNQFTKAAEEGREKPAGANQFTTGKREKLDPATIDAIRAEKAARKVEGIMDAEDATKAEVLAAAKLLMPFGKSTLQSIESRQAEPWQEKTEQEILEQVRALISSRPELLAGVKHLVEPVKPVQDVVDPLLAGDKRSAA